ncbi:DUF6503 family protein [Algoriphagus machipongonensis]|uniref:Lipoprotein n=1 Tax=Algoriphagus machipongonensis TaxID=388413 RepID=A3I2G1_9BACT|nr:hypothetical protein ALPR1_16493 [Algoriphagus machipongonensis]
MKNLLFLGFACCFMLLLSCSENSKETLQLNPEFEKLLNAHGDWEKWINAKAMSFSMIHETTLTQENYFVNLESRKIRLDESTFSIGKDDTGTWVSPRREAFGGRSVDFYHNLYFYFYAIPYVLTDPGVRVLPVENKTVNGTSYKTLHATMNQGVGESSNDQFYLLLHPETGRLEYLLYSVTYFDENSQTLNALKYADYRDADGLVFPRTLTGYVYENDSTKNMKYQVSFADVLILDEPFEDSIFEKPENGVYAD